MREVRLATVWLIINMLWQEPETCGGLDVKRYGAWWDSKKFALEAMQPFQETNLPETLQMLADDSDSELSGKCKYAILCMKRTREWWAKSLLELPAREQSEHAIVDAGTTSRAPTVTPNTQC